MTLTELKYIIALAKEKHFGRAAEACHVSQPSLSIALKKIEAELGVNLFERNSLEVLTTPIGRSVVEQSQRVLEEVDKIRKCVKAGKDPLRGDIKLGVIQTVAPYLMKELLTVLPKFAPQMPLLLSENYAQSLVNELRVGSIDCAVLATPVEEPNLASNPLYEEELVALLPPTSPLAHYEALTLSQVKRETLIFLEGNHCLTTQIKQFLKKNAEPEKNERDTLYASSITSLLCMVSQGLGLAIVPESIAKEYKTTYGVKILRFKGDKPTRTIRIVWRKSFPRIKAIEAISQAVKSLKD